MSKPDGLPYLPEILEAMRHVGLTELRSTVRLLTDDDVEFMYPHVKELPCYSTMRAYLQRCATRISLLEGECDAIGALRSVLGPTRPWQAEVSTIRGCYGASRNPELLINGNIENAYHGSDSSERAQLEIARFFPNFEPGE